MSFLFVVVHAFPTVLNMFTGQAETFNLLRTRAHIICLSMMYARSDCCLTFPIVKVMKVRYSRPSCIWFLTRILYTASMIETCIYFSILLHSSSVGENLRLLVDRPDESYCFRLHKDRVYYVRYIHLFVHLCVY